MNPTALTGIEAKVVAEACGQFGRRLTSAEISHISERTVAERTAAGEATRVLPLFLRLAIKANPYRADVDRLLADHHHLLKTCSAATLAGLIETIARCRALRLPVPVIFSCEKYLTKALQAMPIVRDRFCGIEPIIVRGNATAMIETLDGLILTLPVDDSYEGLPSKIFETFALLHALGAESGVVKIDDDLEGMPASPLDGDSLRGLFASADYIGTQVSTIYHDRSWHVGKCVAALPSVYGKPFRGPWARGALYYLSGRALGLLTHHFMRFPGCLDGEYYEDKAVGDVLRDTGIMLVHQPLEPVLALRTDAPERILAAA